jgi:16S rRNA (cytidine1402-2'-O)-methyltransferase
LISDPGFKLVVAALNEGLHVEMIPGPSAPTTAAALSGLPIDRYLFGGFLPSRHGERSRLLDDLKSIPAALIFFEAPGRVLQTVMNIKAVLGDRRLAIARELTKLHEEVLRGTPDELITEIRSRGDLKGEVTIIVEPPPATPSHDREEVENALYAALLVSSPAKAASEIARKFKVPRRELYALALSWKEKFGGAKNDA